VRCKDPSLRSLLAECLIRLARFLSNNSMYPRDIFRTINIAIHCYDTGHVCKRYIYIYIYI